MSAKVTVPAWAEPHVSPEHSFSIEPNTDNEFSLIDHDLQVTLITGSTPEDIAALCAQNFGFSLELVPEPDDGIEELLERARRSLTRDLLETL